MVQYCSVHVYLNRKRMCLIYHKETQNQPCNTCRLCLDSGDCLVATLHSPNEEVRRGWIVTSARIFYMFSNKHHFLYSVYTSLWKHLFVFSATPRCLVESLLSAVSSLMVSYSVHISLVDNNWPLIGFPCLLSTTVHSGHILLLDLNTLLWINRILTTNKFDWCLFWVVLSSKLVVLRLGHHHPFWLTCNKVVVKRL